MLGHKTREAASCILQPRAWVSNQPSFSFPRTNFSLLGCQSRTEIVGRGTYANKSRSSPQKTSHLRPRNWPERRPTVRQARPLEKGPWEEGHTASQRSRLLPAPAPSDHVRMNENTRVGSGCQPLRESGKGTYRCRARLQKPEQSKWLKVRSMRY